MPEEVNINQEFKAIHIISTGKITTGDLKKSLSEIIKIQNETGFTRILVDHIKAISFPSAVDSFNFGADVGNLLKGTSIALITTNRSESDINFFKDVVNARSGTAHIFYSEKQALQWLSSGQL